MPGNPRLDRPGPPVQRIEAAVTLTINVPGLTPALGEILAKLHGLEQTLATVVSNERIIMATQQEVLDEITQQGTLADSILVLVKRLVSENDPAARQAIYDQLRANRPKLEEAALAGTPQEPTA